MLLAGLISFAVVMLSIGILAVLAERSLARQRGSMLRRGRDERHAASRFSTKIGRWGGGDGGGSA